MRSPRTINTVYDELKLSETLSNELSILTPTVVRIKNQLNSADSMIEAGQMENKSLSEKLAAVSREKTKLQNKLQSHLQSRKVEARKAGEYLAENQGLKEEITVLKKSIEDINRNHLKECEKVKALMEENKTLRLNIKELEKRVKVLEQEQGSYKRVAEELKKVQRTLLTSHGNENNFAKQLEETKSVMKSCQRNLASLKRELTDVHSGNN
eukprot:TRINITY_DN4920_c0_g2_i1.p1 TRINITY_DN4920_c0_g2~~TRINITY_DN4920_c0_g2_i1.p1  ORF type:complete len:211 (+),score=46.97 TRINITY_DN4920_c0_g2_i1:402-1034(+)